MTVPRFPIPLDGGHVALATRASHDVDLGQALRAMGLTTGVPTLAVVGAVGPLASEEATRLGPLFNKVVVPVAKAAGAVVVDAGTRGGLAALLGQARRQCRAEFALLGVPLEDGLDGGDLEPNHTHFVIAPGDVAWWLSEVAGALAGGNRSVTLVASGGPTAWEAVTESVRARRPVLAVARTGGVAHELAIAVRRPDGDGRARRLVASALVQAVDPAQGADHVIDVLGRALGREQGAPPG